jgi:hypothetical protein
MTRRTRVAPGEIFATSSTVEATDPGQAPFYAALEASEGDGGSSRDRERGPDGRN